MFAKFFSRVLAPLFNALAAAILKSDAGKEWLAQSISERVSLKALVQHLDYGALFDEIDTSDMYEEMAKHCNVSASDVADHLDTSDIAQHVELDYSDLAGELDLSEVAGNLDMDDLAGHCNIDTDDVTVDYEALAKALIKELAKPKVEVKSSK
jgi:hypothetical protein